MGQRFSDILNAARLQQQQTFYLNRLQNPPARNPGSGTPRGPQTVVYLDPFKAVIPTSTLLRQNTPTDGFTALSPSILATTEADVATALGASTVAARSGFRAAAIVVNRSTTRTATPTTSGLTGTQYLRYIFDDKFSCKFGRGSATADEEEAFEAIKAEYLANPGGTFEVNRVSWRREKITKR